MTAPGRVPLGLRVAVTGHRWLPSHDPVLRSVVRDALSAIVAAAGNRATDVTPVELVVVSALAEGADRLAAYAGLDLSARLEVVLPTPADRYAHDFPTEASRLEYRDLLAAAASTTLAAHGDRGAASDDPTEGYAAAGRVMVERCDVLLALWDGEQAAGRGGTAEIVAYARDLRIPVCWLRATRTRGTAALAPATGPLDDIGPLTAAAFAELDRYNRAPVPPLPESRPPASAYQPYAVRAETLATRHQARLLLASRTIYALAVVAVTVVAGQLVFFDGHPALAWFEFTALAVLLAVLLTGRRLDVLARWTSARFIAERLRAATCLADIGVQPAFSAVESPPGLARPSGDWAARAVREVWLRHATKSTPPDVDTVRARVEHEWVDDQARYHARVLDRARRRRRLVGVLATTGFAISLVAAFMHALGLLVASGGPDYWAFVSIVVPTAATAIGGYAAQREYARRVAQSAAILAGLAAARRSLDAARTVPEIRRVIAQIDSILHGEVTAWFSSARLHELEIP